MYTTEKEEHIIKKTDYEESKDSALYKLPFIQNIMIAKDEYK